MCLLEKKGSGHLSAWKKLLWCSSQQLLNGRREARRLEDGIHEPWWTAPSQAASDPNLAHGFSELTGKQWNSISFFFFHYFFKQREKDWGEKLANTQNSANGPDRSYCYEISLFHGQDCYVSLARQTEHHVSSWKLLFYPGSWTEGNETSGRSWLERAAGVNSAWSTESYVFMFRNGGHHVCCIVLLLKMENA